MSKGIYSRMDSVKELFDFQKINKDHFEGLLYPVKSTDEHHYPGHYGHPCLGIRIRVQQHDNNLSEFRASIFSIDDSGMTIYGPFEPYEKAQERLFKFMHFIEQHQFRCPSVEEINNNYELGVTAEIY